MKIVMEKPASSTAVRKIDKNPGSAPTWSKKIDKKPTPTRHESDGTGSGSGSECSSSEGALVDTVAGRFVCDYCTQEYHRRDVSVRRWAPEVWTVPCNDCVAGSAPALP